jgi:hypothetical protein
MSCETRAERVNLFDLAGDPGPMPEDPGQRPPEGQAEAVRSWEAKLAAFGVWTTRHRRFQLGKCLKSLRAIPAEERTVAESTLIVVGVIILAGEAGSKGVLETVMGL